MNPYRLPFDPELLSTFLAVADTGKISAAASTLGVSQPSITARVRQLESDLGTQLFTRSVLGVDLTPAGIKFYDRAKQIVELLTAAASEANRDEKTKGLLNIAASTTIADHILPPLLADFKKRNPQISVTLSIKNTEEVLNLVRDGLYPIGLVEGHARAASVRLEPFHEDELLLIVPPGWADKIRKPADLVKFPILVREPGSGTRSVTEKELKKNGLPLKNFNEIIEIGSSAAIKSAVAAELGISFLSRASVANELALGKIANVRLSEFKMTRVFHWALPSGGLSQPAAEFYRFAQGSVSIRSPKPREV